MQRRRVCFVVLLVLAVGIILSDFTSESEYQSPSEGGAYVTNLPADFYDPNKGQLTERAQELLSFTVIGFSKCGTSFLQNTLLPSAPEVCMPRKELRVKNEEYLAVETAEALYNLGNSSTCRVRGFKSPSQIRKPNSIHMISTLWPKAKLIVGVRHPVLWFQSLYNYRINMTSPPEKLLGGNCEQEVCTDNAKFHLDLSYFGKTALESSEELSLLREETGEKHWDETRVISPPVPNKIFLYELSQLSYVENPEVFEAFRMDLSKFLGLNHSLSSPSKIRKHKRKEERMTNIINICEPRYQDLRSQLVRISSRAADWILNYFIKSSDVTISSLAYFAQELQKWHHDPCSSTRHI